MTAAGEKCTMFGGWLYYYKPKRFSWLLQQSLKRKYFVLADTELRCYSHLDDPSPVNTIKLKHYKGVHKQDTMNHKDLFGFCLAFTSSKEELVLYAETERGRQEWIQHLDTGSSSAYNNCSPPTTTTRFPSSSYTNISDISSNSSISISTHSLLYPNISYTQQPSSLSAIQPFLVLEAAERCIYSTRNNLDCDALCPGCNIIPLSPPPFKKK